MNEPSTIRRPATYQDVLDAPPHMVAEIANGALHLHPRPALRHARATTRLGARLDDPFENGVGGPGGWYFATEPELHLGEDVVVPDWSGWRRDRMPVFPSVPFFTQAPDWICEIVSPSTGRIDRSRKMRIYGRASVAHLWLVDPLLRTVEGYRLDGEAWTVAGVWSGDEKVRIEPFADIELALGRWWVPEPPATP